MASSPRPKFTSDQKIWLRALGVLDSQIEQLELTALPVAKALLAKPEKLQNVRDELNRYRDLLRETLKQTNSLLSAPLGNSAKAEVLTRVLHSAWEKEIDTRVLEQTRASLEAVLLISEHAASILPKDERRDRKANPLPVKLIDDALVQGFWRGHPQDRPLPPYTLSPSYAPKSRYREIVGICYSVMLSQEKIADPERAIRAFISWRKQSRALLRASFETINVSSKQPRRKRRTAGGRKI